MPLLDLLANRVKAVRRLKELLMLKLPPGMVPVKVRGGRGRAALECGDWAGRMVVVY